MDHITLSRCSFYVLLALLCTFTSCTPKYTERALPNMYNIDKLATMVLFVDTTMMGESVHDMQYEIKNISTRNITIMEPTCFGRNVRPKLLAANGKEIQASLRYHFKCAVNFIELRPQESRIYKYPYSIEELYKLNKSETYSIKIIFDGAILEDATNKYMEFICESNEVSIGKE